MVKSSTPSTELTQVRSVVIRMKFRADANEAAIAFGLSGAAEAQYGEAEEDDTVDWADVLSEEWRVLDI